MKPAKRTGDRISKLLGVLLVGVCLAIAVGTSAEGASAAMPVTAAVRVTVNIPGFVKLEVVRTFSQVTVTQADVERGYVDIPAGTELRLWTNSKQGTRILVRAALGGDTASLAGPVVPNLAYRMSGSAGSSFVPVTSSSETIYQGPQKEIGASKVIDYRINLGWGIPAGTYPIDLLFTALPNQ